MMDAFGNPQSIVVLGGTSDIGLAIAARALSPTLQRVVLAGRDGERLEQVAVSLRAEGVPTVATVVFQADGDTDAGQVVEACFGATGGDVDLVVLAVGDLGHQAHGEFDPVATAKALTVNGTWPAAALAAVAGRLRGQGHGQIVVLSSVAGVRLRRSNYVYGAAKAGLDAYARALGESLLGTGVHVLVVRPGFVRSKMTEGLPSAPFSVDPDDVGRAVARARGDGTAVVWVPGVLRWLFLVLRHLPEPLWRKLSGRMS